MLGRHKSARWSDMTGKCGEFPGPRLQGQGAEKAEMAEKAGIAEFVRFRPGSLEECRPG